MQAIELNSNISKLHAPVCKSIEIGERVTACFILAIVSPLLVFAAATVFVLSGRSPFIAHQRVGRSGQPLWLLKLRTMWVHSDSGPLCWIERVSPAIGTVLMPSLKARSVSSRFAAFCRRYSVDELPQLWHVARGEMSLVGPRPITQHEMDKFYGHDAALILAARPGLTGLWQINGRSRLNYAQRRRLDLFLVRHWSLTLYLRILLRTIPCVLSGKDAW